MEDLNGNYAILLLYKLCLCLLFTLGLLPTLDDFIDLFSTLKAPQHVKAHSCLESLSEKKRKHEHHVSASPVYLPFPTGAYTVIVMYSLQLL